MRRCMLLAFGATLLIDIPTCAKPKLGTMAFASILWPLSGMVQTFPYMIAVLWIMISAFYDVSFVLQQSMFLCLYFYFTNMLERFLCFYLNVSDKCDYLKTISLNDYVFIPGGERIPEHIRQFGVTGHSVCQCNWPFPTITVFIKCHLICRAHLQFVASTRRTCANVHRNGANYSLHFQHWRSIAKCHL